jgi:hypothetical protein
VRANIAEWVVALARHFDFAASEAAVAAAVAAFPTSRAVTCEGEDYWPAAIPELARTGMRGAFAGYEECFVGRGLGQIVWNRDLFIANDPEKGTSDALDVSGGARILIFGPYIHLPPCPWTAQVRLGFSQEAAGHVFLIDAYSDRQLAAATLKPPSGGIYVADLSFSLGEPSGQGFQIRVAVSEDNAKGQLVFGEVVLTPVAAATPQIDAEWAHEAKATLGL